MIAVIAIIAKAISKCFNRRVVTRYVFSSLIPFSVPKFLILDSKSVTTFVPCSHKNGHGKPDP